MEAASKYMEVLEIALASSSASMYLDSRGLESGMPSSNPSEGPWYCAPAVCSPLLILFRVSYRSDMFLGRAQGCRLDPFSEPEVFRTGSFVCPVCVPAPPVSFYR